MYRCNICGTIFDRPYINKWLEPMPDGFFEKRKDVLCPVCYQPHFDEIMEEEHEEI